MPFALTRCSASWQILANVKIGFKRASEWARPPKECLLEDLRLLNKNWQHKRRQLFEIQFATVAQALLNKNTSIELAL
jgi:hypothetical protein